MTNANFHMREGKVEFRWKRWRNKKRQEVSSCLMVLFSGAVLLGGGGVALAGPTGGQVTGGQGTITTPDGTTTNINQQSNVLNINWQDFSIQQGETVNFYQPGSTSIAINRVVGGVPSYLAGALNANGRVFILNSAGITFTGTSQVNVGALLATTAMTVNGDPTQAASYSGSGYGAVINQGSISVSNGGFAILAAPYVQNTGFIKADLGTIALAGTNQFTLDLSGTGLINFVVPAGAVEKIVSDGKAVGVDNAGTLQARSGQVLISANVASEVVNAVVNLNGIVDADAFAPNGQGGAVLVSAAGDINVGGQVTARGDGTGAGGQIVTKAAGNDAIGALAYVSATGGAGGGKGGLIEVSGKGVVLAGAIDPGKGGLLYIDPATFTIKNGTSGQGTNFIGEHRLEQLLQNGAGFLVNAAGDITIQDLSDNVLAGGGGDLTLHAGTGGAGNIIVQGVNDIIRTGSGDVTLTAAGNIGDPAHELSFVSGGANLNGVSQAGDIILTATNGGNIYINSVTERAAGPGTRHALFSANAAGVFSADGLIDLEVRANGVGTQSADAEVHITADQLRLGGVTVLANATKRASSNSNTGGSAFANAIVTLNANHAEDNGAMTVAASVAGSSGFRFHANAELIVNEQTGFNVKGGPISVTARANAFSAGTSSVLDNAVLAEAGLRVNGSGAVDIDSLGVHATALGDKVANDVALADAQLNGNDIRIRGNAIVTASGQAGPSGAHLVVARATMNATGTAVDLSSNVAVTAQANNPDLGRGASATADLRLVAVTQNVTVGGGITVNATALNDGSSFAAASAALIVRGNQGIDVDGNVTALASALTLAENGTDIHRPHATATASFQVNDGNIRIGGGLDVEANISSNNSDSVIARALAHLTASGTEAGNIEIDGATKVIAAAKTSAHTGFGSPSAAAATASLSVHAEGHVNMGAITVKATADDLGSFGARAIASADIHAGIGAVTINGPVDVEANAQDPAGGSAFANAKFKAFGAAGVAIGVAGNGDSGTILGDVTVKANADNGGNGSASANATLSLQGQDGPVAVVGNVTVDAEASDAGGGNALASANAFIAGSGTGEASAVTIDGDIDVTANAEDAGGGQAKAVSQVKISGSGSESGGVVVHGAITVAANALNDGTSAAKVAASANALLQFSSAQHVTVDGPMTVAANGTNSGLGKVLAQGAVKFGGASSIQLGDVTIDVKARNLGNGNGGAKALASFNQTGSSGTSLSLTSLNLQAQASSFGQGDAVASAIGKITQRHLVIPGAVTVNAFALHGTNGAGNALALADLELRGTGSDLHVGSGITVHANAVDNGAGLAQANAYALLATGSGPSSNIHVDGHLLISADAFANEGQAGNVAASANAQLVFEGGANTVVTSNMSVVAHATNMGAGKVLSQGGISFTTSGSINLAGVTIDVRALNLGSAGTGGAVANAVFAPSGTKISLDALNLQAQASSQGGHGANALASAALSQRDIAIASGITVNAQAVSHGGGNAVANANLLLSATSGDLTVSSAIDVHANAQAGGAGQAEANAIVILSAFSDEGDNGGSIDVGNVNVIANALHTGAGAGALAFAELLIDPEVDPQSVTIGGDVNVEASANNVNGFAGNLAASASALFSAGDIASLTIDGDVTVLAHATNKGKGRVFAQGSVNFSSVGNVTLQSLTIDVAALNIGTGSQAGSGGAQANAIFKAASASNVNVDGLNLQADASSHGPGNAHALASGSLVGGQLAISGDVTINAAAQTAGGNATADANLLLKASSADLAIAGDVSVIANAHAANAGGHAFASAIGELDASASEGPAHNISVNSVDINASAGIAGGAEAKAVAELTIDPPAPASFHVNGDLTIVANATNPGGAASTNGVGASANALLTVGSIGKFAVDGALLIAAHGTNSGNGKVNAFGAADFGSVSSIVLNRVTIDVAALNKGSGNGGASASANFSPTAQHVTLNQLNLQAQASSNGGGDATANAIANLTQHTIVISSGVDVNAVAHTVGAGDAAAIASLDLTANQANIDIGSHMNVTASAHHGGGGTGAALANAIATLNAVGGDDTAKAVTVAAALVKAVASDTSGAGGSAIAHAHFTLDPASGGGTGSIHITGPVTVSANAYDRDGHSEGTAASADAQLNFSGAPIVTVDGPMTVVAHGTNSGAGKVKAAGVVSFSGATNLDLSSVTIDVRALNLGSGSGGAKASANFSPTAQTVHIDALNLQAQASSHGGGNATANAIGVIHQQTLSISGDAIVNAFAFTDGSNGRAKALASLDASASNGDLTIRGNVDVTAVAKASDPLSAIATADVALFAEGAVHLIDNVVVAATASTNAGSEGVTGDVFANARLNVHGCEGVHFGSSSLINGQLVLFDGDISVSANEFSNRAQRGAARAVASIEAGPGVEGSGGLLIDGNVQVEADAGGGSSEANVIAYAQLNAQATDGIDFRRGIDIIANADDHGTGAAWAGAYGTLTEAGSGSISVAGDILVNAQLQGNGLDFGPNGNASLGIAIWAGYASAILTVDGGESAGDVRLGGVTVIANTLLTNSGEGRIIGEWPVAWGGAFAEANIVSSSGSVFIDGPVRVNALGIVSATNMLVGGTAELFIKASGDVTIAGPVHARGNAQALGTGDTANATVIVEMDGSDITLPGVGAAAIANAPGESALAKATANVQLNASHDLSITNSGAFAGALAKASSASDGEHVMANANLQLIAGHNLTDNGSIIAAAGARGGGTGDVANAIVNIQAGGSGSGNVQVIGDIGAFAFADPVNDHALASVTIHAHNNILVIGNDPIASAKAGNAAAFLQTHFTDSTTGFGGSGSSAIAKITITAGGNIVFINPDFDNVLALLALPTQTPTIQPGDLTTIEMLIDGQDCGVLGSAGADPGKPACGKVAINIPPGDDALP